MDAWKTVWSLCFGLLATLIVVGNVLTIWIFLKQRLRKRAHFLLISLAVADLLVGLLIVPLFVADIANFGAEWYWARLVFSFGDIFTGLTSIYTLAVISLERMYAIGWPLRHRTLNFRVYMFAIVIPWILAAIFASIVLLLHLSVITHKHFLYSLIYYQSMPLLVMCTAYCVIRKKQKSSMGNQNHVTREAKLAKTLFMITGASLLTWLPFQIINKFVNFDVIRYFPYLNATVYIVKFLQFSNSLVNVIIYPFRISDFKNALLQVFHCCVIPCERGNELAPIHPVRLDQIHHCQEFQVPNH